MINGKKILAVIPARGGSKGIPRKNIKNIGGKPLIAWTIEEAKKSKYIDRLILSSEDKEIIQVAKDYGCDVPFTRPINLAQDTTPSVDVLLHAIDMLPDYDYVLLLQPTSPLRDVDDIDGCILTCTNNNLNSLVTVTIAEKSPYWIFTKDSNNFLQPILEHSPNTLITRRQALPVYFVLNGAINICSCKWLNKTNQLLTYETYGYEMPQIRSIDIDNLYDLKICELFLKTRK